MGVQVISDNEFQTEVLGANGLVMVYFWATWCGPCRLMAPVVDWAADQFGDRLKIVKMEVDPNPDAVAKCAVQGVPAIVLFQDGQQLTATEGALTKPRLEEVISPYLPAS
jgi:thioredoxin 1